MSTGESRRRNAIHEDTMALVAALQSLQRACREAIEQSGIHATSARALGDALGLDKMLAWKLQSLAAAEEVASATNFIMGHRGWWRVCEAFEHHGLADRASAIREAWRTFDAELKRVGLSRSMLGPLMASSAAGPTACAVTGAWSALSDANAAIWGVSESAVLHSWILAPADHRDRLSIGRIRLHHGLHRTRPGPEWYLQGPVVGRRHSDVPDKDRPDESDAPWQAVPCDDLLSAAAEAELGRPAGDRVGSVTFDGRGTSSRERIDLVLAHRASPVAHQHARMPDEWASFGASIQVPTRLLVLDVLLDDRIPWTVPPEATMVLRSAFLASSPEVRRLQDLSMSESSEAPIASPSDHDLRPPPSIRGVDSMYRTALERVLACMGADRSRLVLHRLVVPCPVLYTTVSLRWRMPPPPR